MSSPSHLASFKDKAPKLETAESINDLFANVDLGTVTELDMSGNTIGVEAGKALAALISKMPNLQIARLDNIFTTRSISEIPLALTPICTALSSLPHLTSVDLSDNAFGQRSVSAVAPLLSSGPPLQTLKLGNIGMNIEGGREIASLLLQDNTQSSLQTLVLSRNLLGDGSAESWAQVISAHKDTLRRFESNRNDFREMGIIAIGNALLLAASSNLEHLTIEDAVVANSANDKVEGMTRGYTLISNVVRASAPNLKVLHLPSCAFRSAGADELVDALSSKSYPKLKSLRLEHNELKDEHFEKLLGAVRAKMPALTFLRVTVDDETEDSEHLKEIAQILQARRGKVVVLHEDVFSDEEDVEEDEEEDEEEAGGRKPAPVDVRKQTEGDALAELVDKLTLSTK